MLPGARGASRDGTGATKLTTNYNAEANPAVSPDGSRIAYEFLRGIWVMNADGSGQTNLTSEDELNQCPNSPGYYFNGASRSPAWSPDGGEIAFAGPVICPYPMGNNIWTMNADGSAKTSLNNDNGSSDLKPVFSPDGTRVIFESNRDGNGSPLELYSMSADGGAITRITTNSVWDSDADWAVSSPACTVTGSGAIEGTAGNDVICGGPNNDTIDGLGGNDVVLGGAGNDTLAGDSGRDTLNGGPGTDTASFDVSAAPVEASLVTGFGLRTGTPEGVALVGIENVTGSDRADTLTGSAGANTLVGGKGADELLGGAGGDRLNAKDGIKDTVNGGGGTDRCITDPRETSIRACE